MMFTEPLAVAIVKGQKTATRRAVNYANVRSPWALESRSYPVGKVFTVNPGRGVKRIAEAEVTRRSMQALGVVTPEQARQEGFRSVLAFRDAWAKINGSFHPTDLVHVIEFKLVGPDCPFCEGRGSQPGSAFGLDVGFGVVTAATRPCFDCYGTGVIVSVPAVALIAKVEAGR
jgi:uncharacterized protein YhfF